MDSYGEYYQYIILFFGILFYLTLFCVKFDLSENDTNTFAKYQKKDLIRSMYFLSTIICLELIVVLITMSSRCSNISRAIIYPILIWIFVFLGTKIALLTYPGFKSAFSDVIGYSLTYGIKQNEYINYLLSNSPDHSDVVTNIISDKGLLFNSIVPGNFEIIWQSLEPKLNSTLTDAEKYDAKQKILNLVVQRDHIGEGCWLLWSGILCIAIVSLYVYSFPCELTPAQVRENKGNYDKQIQEDLDRPELTFVNY